MKQWFSLSDVRNKFRYISDQEFRKFIDFAAQNPEIVTLPQVHEKMMIMDFVLPLLKESFSGGKILEIGCGSGVHSALLSNLGTVSATELKSTVFWLGDSVDKTRDTVFEALAQGPVEFLYNDGKVIPFEDRTFDLVFHNSVIEHVPGIIAFNEEVRRVLKPGGICVCITGTPTLCRFRYFKEYLLRFPLIAGYGVATVVLDKLLSRTNAGQMLYLKYPIWHFQPTGVRLQSILDHQYLGQEETQDEVSLPSRVLRDMYPSIRHFIREPAYNRILIEEIAERHGVSPRSLLLQLIRHFKFWLNDLRFRTTPSTHSQHTKNFRTEIKEWQIENWERSFTDARFHVEKVCGYRYQQALDITYSDRANAWLNFHALPLVRKAANKLPPKFASEIVILARAQA